MAVGPGDFLGPYRLIEPLGRGGMGEVFAATNDRIGQRVAIKILAQVADTPLLTNSAERVRLLREGQALAQVDHPNVVRILACDETPEGVLYLVMERLEGASLRAWRAAQTHAVSWPTCVALGWQIADAMAAVHERKIVHRDLKPENVMLTPDRTQISGWRAKVVDFGLAKVHLPPADPRVTQLETGEATVLGTVVYMPPEQIRRAAAVTDRADVYALGVMLYELLAGRPPFASTEAIEILHDHLKTPPPPLLRFAPTTPPPLCALLKAMLDKDPARRPDMAAVRLILSQIDGRPGAPDRRLLKAGALLGLVLAILYAARTGDGWLQRRQAAVERQRAELLLRQVLFDTEQWVDDTDWELAQRPWTLEVRQNKLDHYAATLGALPAVDRERPEVLEWTIKVRHRLGDTAFHAGTLALAATDFTTARQAIEQGLRHYPGDRQLHILRALNDSKRGKIAAALGQTHEAESAFSASIKTLQSVVGDRLDDPDDRRMLAVSLDELAMILAEQGLLSESLERFREALALLGQNTGRYDHWLRASVQASFAAALDQAGRLREAEEATQHGLALLAPLSRKSPDNAAYRCTLAELQGRLASLHGQEGRLAEARSSFAEALRLGHEAVEQDPTRKGYALTLCQLMLDRAALALQEGHLTQARQLRAECRSLTTMFLERDPQDHRFQRLAARLPPL